MKNLYILFLTVLTQSISAQDREFNSNSEDHRNELGVANTVIYILNEKEFAYGLHAHFTRSINETRFGIGVAYERIFDEHKHNTAGLILSYSPIEHFVLSLSPGITFNNSDLSDLHFGLHIEALYEFEIGKFHIGPVTEFAYSSEDYHLSLGVHIGLGF